MKKGGVVFLVSVFAVILLLIGTNALVGVFRNLPKGERDVSWIDDVEDFIEEVKPSEPIERWHSICGARFSLYENGSQQILYQVYYDETGETDDSFVTHMVSLMHKINNIINTTVSSELFHEILEKNKVLQVDFGTDSREFFWRVNSYTVAFFILEDNLNKDLEGTIFISQQFLVFPNWETEETLREIRK